MMRQSLGKAAAEKLLPYSHMGRILETLKKHGELENTLIIFTADNGMPMPRAKANGYDYGIHVPLYMRWDEKGQKGQVIDGPVGFTDISATILAAAGLPVPDRYVGRSLLPLLDDRETDLAAPPDVAAPPESDDPAPLPPPLP